MEFKVNLFIHNSLQLFMSFQELLPASSALPAEKDKSRRKYKKVLSNYDNLLIYYSRHFMFIIIYAPLVEYFYAEDVFLGQ